MKTNLQQLRRAAGYKSAESFAKVLGIPARTLRNFEQGINDMSFELALRICNLLRCTLDELLGRSNEGLTMDEAELVEIYRSLPEDSQNAVITGLRAFAETKRKNNEG